MNKNAINPTREENFAEWYQKIIKAADLAEGSVVRGCMIIKPYGYAIWENIQKIFDERIKKIGVQNAYFPLLIPLEFLSKEAEHIDGFAKECAVVTHHRLKYDHDLKTLIPDGKLESPYIIRPTSEAIIGHTISKWINTYRDLPLKLNQWCNVMRWEMRPRIFLRTSEFLWQEGHNAFETENEAKADSLKMLDMYYNLISDDLAMPAIKGEKTEDEKFPGAKNTYTIEVMMQDGKAIQAGTSHYLGQTFSKAFDIKFLGKDNKEHNVYTTSWGITTRLIGGIIMTHADDDGLVLPPNIAPYQIVIIPIIHDISKKNEIINYCNLIKEKLDNLNIRTNIDDSDISTPNKIWKWIKKGAPIRFEIGLNELTNNEITSSRRDLGKEGKLKIKFNDIENIKDNLDEINNNLKLKALKYTNDKIIKIDNINDLKELFKNNFKGFVIVKKEICNNNDFNLIKKEYSLSIRCIPFDSKYNNDSLEYIIVGKSY